MFGLVVAIDKPTSEEVVRRRSYLTDIAGNLGGGVSHGWQFQFRNSLRALKGKRRRKTDLIPIKMLGGHVWIVHRHSEKRSLLKDALGFGTFDHRLERGAYSFHLEGIRNPNVGDLPFGYVDQPHGKSGSLFFRPMGRRYSCPEKSSLQILLFLISPFFR